MRVLFVTRGLDRTEQALVASLRADGVELEVFCQPEGAGFKEIQHANVPVTPIGFSSRVCFSAIRQLRRAYQEKRTQIVHSVDGRALSNCVWAAYGSSVKIIAYRGTLGNLHYYDPSSLLSQLNPRVNRIICNCEAVKKELAKRVSDKKLVRIYKGHDPKWYDYSEKVALNQFRIPAGAFVVGCIANTRPHKGVHLLIEAVHQLKHPNLHLLLVGDVNQKSLLHLADSGAAASNIHFAGYRADAAQIIGSCDLCALVSLREGFPRVVIEAALQGVPAVVSDVGGMPEIVNHNITGWIIPSGDVSALAEVLNDAMSDRKKVREFGVAARQRVTNEFSLGQTIIATKKLYQDLLC